jgi:hypothetical protein
MVLNSQTNQSSVTLSRADLVHMLRNAVPVDTAAQGPIDILKMDPAAFMSRVGAIKYLEPASLEQKENLTLFRAGTLAEAKAKATAAAGGFKQIKEAKTREWDITHDAARSSPDYLETGGIREKLSESGNKAFSAVIRIIHDKIGTMANDMRNDAAEDATMAMRLILLKDMNFDNKEALVKAYNAKMNAWDAGICVAACVGEKVIGYYPDALTIRQDTVPA